MAWKSPTFFQEASKICKAELDMVKIVGLYFPGIVMRIILTGEN